MNNQSTIELLREMKFSAMAHEFVTQLEDPKTYSVLEFEERFALLVDAEWNRRQNNKLTRLIKSAKFSAPNASIEGIEYHEDRKLSKSEILRYATCKYIDDKHHIILKGASGNGKTYIACALGNAACRKFKSVSAPSKRWIFLFWMNGLSGHFHHKKHMTSLRLSNLAAKVDQSYSVHNMNRKDGMNASTLILKMTALFRMLLWIELFITPMRF